MDKLRSSRLKLARAEHHIAELERSVAAFFQTNWYSMTFSDAQGALSLNVTIKGTPEHFSVLVGDALHNLRAALDVMAVDVVRANGGSGDDAYFPFSRDASALEHAIRARFSGASQAAQDKIRALKPYQTGNPELRALHDLDIQDKHRELIPECTSITTPPIRVKTEPDGTPVGFHSGKLELEVIDEPPTIVHTFSQSGPAGGQGVISTLKALHATVTGIVDDFETIV